MTAPRIAVYNPDLLSRDDAVAGFVARQVNLRRLEVDLSRDRPNHHLIVGPRGMGKTTLLRRLYFAIFEDPTLASSWIPLVFREEQYNVHRLSDLWLNCLDALSDTLEERNRSTDSAAMDAMVDAIREQPEPKRERDSLAALTDWSRRNGRRLVLLIDNFDLVLDRLSVDVHWKLREVLSSGQLLVVGASATPPPSVYEYDQAFYDFFKLESLRGLDDRETSLMLLALSDARGTPEVRDIVLRDPGRLKTLRVLTGGNPRAIVMVHQLLARGDVRTVVDDVMALLDMSTPYYKSRFEALAQQAQVIVDGLALAWDPIPAGEVARRVHLDGNIVSAQLNRLVQDGVVEKVRYPGTRGGYQIAERLFNIWYLMRASRHARRKLIWLVQFLHQFYGPGVVSQRAAEIAKHGRDARDGEFLLSLATMIRHENRFALELRALELLSVNPDWTPERFAASLDLEGQDRHLASPAERMARLKEIRRKLKKLPPLQDGTSLADAVTCLFVGLSNREQLAARLLDADTRAAALEEVKRLSVVPREWPELLAYRSCLSRGILAGDEIDVDAARRIRELEPDAYEFVIQVASFAIYDSPPSEARRHAVDALSSDVARCKRPRSWWNWLQAADKLDAFDSVKALFAGVPPEQRSADFWSDVYGGVWTLRVSGWPAEHHLRRLDAAPQAPDVNAKRYLAGVVACDLSVLKQVAQRVPFPDALALLGRWDEATHQAESDGLDRLAEVDLRFMLRGAVLHGRSADSLSWMDSTGLGDRFRPLREAVASIVSGPDHLLTVAPEVREPAAQIAKWLSFRRETPTASAEQSAKQSPGPVANAAPRRRTTTRTRPKKTRGKPASVRR